MPNDMWTTFAHQALSTAALAQPGSNPSNQSLGGGEAAPAGPVAGGTTAAPGTTATPAGPATAAPSPFGPQFLLLLFLMIGFMFFMQWRSGKTEKKKRQDMIDALGKGDTVQTIGGEIGVIADIREHEIVLKFEDGKVRFVKSAILSVVKSARSKDGASAAIEPKDAKEPAKA